MNKALLNYYLDLAGVSRSDLMDRMGWSPGTAHKRCGKGSGWRVDELRILLDLGLSETDVEKIFLRDTQEEQP